MRGTVLSLLIFVLTLLCHDSAMAQSAESFRDVKSIINKIEETTSYHFLYRDALIAGVKVPAASLSPNPLSTLKEALSKQNIGIQIDSTRRQILIFELPQPKTYETFFLGGQVVNANSGARLPSASVTWYMNGNLQGTSTDANGNFQIKLKRKNLPPELNFTFSYVGYHHTNLTIARTRQSLNDLTVRLEPYSFLSQEVIITGSTFYKSDNRSMKSFVQLGTFSPVGESSSIRSLQLFPSVSLTAGLHEGINIRGSDSDGLQVLLDGATIYNQSHLFGLLDIFNSDALQTIGFNYDITPAEYQGTLGGTLSFMTRTGSQTKNEVTAGLSNTAYKATLEGPIAGGKGSWLISGRHSYMNTINWFNNQKLIAWGLNVDRPSSAGSSSENGVYTKTSYPLKPKADFYDLHTKLLYEFPKGSRLILSSYIGGDLTNQNTNRYIQTGVSPDFTTQFALRNFKTKNNWGNTSISLQYIQPVFSESYSHSLIAYSYYHSNYYKQDFFYLQKQALADTSQVIQYPFSNQNDLNDLKISQQFDTPTSLGTWINGFTLHRYNITYNEESVLDPGYIKIFKSSQFDLFSEYDITNPDLIHVHLGGRTHYFSDGGYFRISPRIKLKFLPNKPVSFGLGFSRNYQFIHRISLYNETSSDLWILSTKDQGPSSLNYWSSGIYIKPFKSTYFQAEGYIKNSWNLRIHDISTRALSQTNINAPWFDNTRGFAKGLEFLFQQHISKLIWNTTYTWSKTQLQNPEINNGQRYYADWDRRDKFSTNIELPVFKHLTFYANWVYATGTPNRLKEVIKTEKSRLPDYHRLDTSLKFHQKVNSVRIDASVSLFNVLNTHNVWYREYSQVIDNSGIFPKIQYYPVDVYDLGFQPSFELSIRF